MSLTALSLPIDVPWKRLAASTDMYVKSINDDLRQLIWNSSLAVFYFEPEPDPNSNPDEVTTFLKVVASVTGYEHSFVIHVPLNDKGIGGVGGLDIPLGDPQYYPCYSATLQVAAVPGSPRPDGEDWVPSEYPYFTDFEPKKREIVELATDTAEALTRSTSALNVRKGTTGTDSTEAIDINHGFSFSESTGVQGVSQSTAGDFKREIGGQTKLGVEATNIITTDASREKRESYSHTTNLAQLYQLLDSYHAGTNRALFFLNARPHLIQSPYTFVNGPRQLEGIQEFFLVLRRPKEMHDFCVKAVLETAHLHEWDEPVPPAPPPVPKTGVASVTCSLENPGTAFVSGTSSKPGSWQIVIPSGNRLDVSKGGGTIEFHFDLSGNKITYDLPPGVDIQVDNYRTLGDTAPKITAYETLVTINASADNWYAPLGTPGGSTASLQFTVTAHYVEIPSTEGAAGAVPAVNHNCELYVLGREVIGCAGARAAPPTSSGPWLLYEKSLPPVLTNALQLAKQPGAGAAQAANMVSRAIRTELETSYVSPDRLAIGQAQFSDSRIIYQALMNRVNPALVHDANRPLHSLQAIDAGLRKRLESEAPKFSIGEALIMPPEEIAGALRVSPIEVRRLLTPVLATATSALLARRAR